MTPADLSRSLGHRLRNIAADRGTDPARLRRHVVFQRILARLAPTGDWVLKGGFCLEIRLGLDARATQDLDFTMLSDDASMSALDLQDALTDALDSDADQDAFRFEVALPTQLVMTDAGSSTWRVKVHALVGGRHFENVKLDIALKSQEIDGGTETLLIEPIVPDIGHSFVTMPSVDVAQHAAEKVHAYSRIYSHDRPSSRVKDLIDLVLLIEAELLAPVSWGKRLHHVFTVREAASPPSELPKQRAG